MKKLHYKGLVILENIDGDGTCSVGHYGRLGEYYCLSLVSSVEDGKTYIDNLKPSMRKYIDLKKKMFK